MAIWSRQSVNSLWVHDEAQYALEQKKLVPVLADDVDLPLGFRGVHTADLRGWRGNLQHPGYQRLVRDISERLGAAPDRIIDDQPKQPTPPPPSVNHRKRWISLLGAVAVVAVTGAVVWRPNSSSTIRVPARPLDWSHCIFTSSNIHVEANQRVTFNAYGQWYIGAPGSEGIGPEGVEVPCECVVSNEKGGGRQGSLGALIGNWRRRRAILSQRREDNCGREKWQIFLGSNDNSLFIGHEKQDKAYRSELGHVERELEKLQKVFLQEALTPEELEGEGE